MERNLGKRAVNTHKCLNRTWMPPNNGGKEITKKIILCRILLLYSQTTSNFHVVSRNKPVTFGFSARHVIDLPSSSVDGTKLNSERLVVFVVSSCKEKKMKKMKVTIWMKKCSMLVSEKCMFETRQDDVEKHEWEKENKNGTRETNREKISTRYVPSCDNLRFRRCFRCATFSVFPCYSHNFIIKPFPGIFAW